MGMMTHVLSNRDFHTEMNAESETFGNVTRHLSIGTQLDTLRLIIDMQRMRLTVICDM